MGIDKDFGLAYAKSQMASQNSLPTKGLAFISLKDRHKNEGVDLAKQLIKLGFTLCGTCLLYTSPSPRDRQKSRMPSSA